ncbi:hypothetical protein F2P81_018585 [Scophthalmus maximus]|uniref:Aryl hydrocarbon receptor nuclear translocator-like protein 2 n=1 Tax=Scophthalmus maximus TaxID=52904 RepID=A0A6A4SCI8_SCOMX|nr:hypothetical protein F2P81_018585 [Scophthalmus maximus]
MLTIYTCPPAQNGHCCFLDGTFRPLSWHSANFLTRKKLCDVGVAVCTAELCEEEGPGQAVPSLPAVELPRKRKGDVEEREPHRQIEKRRRDKMNNLIEELSAMIPACQPLTRKLDKLTVLRKAVQHLKAMKVGTSGAFTDANNKPSILPHDDLGHLLLSAADSFLLVVSCDRAKIMFISESVSKILNLSRLELTGQSLFDFIHPKDINKLKEQLSSSELHPRQRLIDPATGAQVQADAPVRGSHLSTGARRAFLCRMKHSRLAGKHKDKRPLPSASKQKGACSSTVPFGDKVDNVVDRQFKTAATAQWTFPRISTGVCRVFTELGFAESHTYRYCTLHCTGYMRSWPGSQTDSEGDGEKETSHLTCLVTVCRLHPHASHHPPKDISTKPPEFVTRCAIDGKFTFVDQQATTVIGYLPQEVLGTSCYEYFHQDDLQHLAEKHRQVLRSKEKIETKCYKFKTKYGSYVSLQSQWCSFTNPWTKEVEFIVSQNRVVSRHKATIHNSWPFQRFRHHDLRRQFRDPNRQRAHRRLQAVLVAREGYIGMHGKFIRIFDIQVDFLCKGGPTQLDLDNMVPGLSSFSNDEAAMAVIMSLLETDVNMGQSEDFEDLHWPF